MALSGKTAVVTGAAGAIGRAVAARLAADGASLLLVDRPGAPLDALVEGLGARASAWPADLGDERGVETLAATMLDGVGAIDILVNNAGILSNNKSADTSIAEWRAVHAVNVEAAFLITRALLPAMRARRFGRIVNMASYAAKSGGLTAGTAYSVSKAAMIGLTFSIAREAAGDGVTANAVAPAYVMSPMVSEQLTETQRQAQLAQIPVGRFCTPEEVAHTVSFLASPLAGFITGEVIDMNGGLQFD